LIKYIRKTYVFPGVLEHWSVGVLDSWNIGMMEYWNDGSEVTN
jgi:hypothetical protein